ncbi:MAG TPA: hypothetical protein GX405_03125 [Rhizobiales bacterium]|nr:hypothetical protein [Hyphomicrobiales bacterium]
MIGTLTRIVDNLLGRGEAAVTVPPLDGAFRPNRLLDEAPVRLTLEGADGLAVVAGTVVASAGDTILALGADGTWHTRRRCPATVTAIAAVGDGGLAAALASGEILFDGGALDGRGFRAGENLRCITAIAVSGDGLYVANGSATNAPAGWQRDLLERNASGSIWRIDLGSGASTRLAARLAWPAGLALDAEGVVFSEAWRHQLVRLDGARPDRTRVLQHDLPGYPGRLAPASDGWWLAMFAPRSQLVEFVLREPSYRKRMMAEVPEPYWVAPKLRAGRSFLESLQGGGVKHLGLLKPWAPAMSAGLCVRLDRAFNPRFSLQSRADGRTHGVTAVAESGDRVFVAASGDGVVVSLPLADLGDGGGRA